MTMEDWVLGQAWLSWSAGFSWIWIVLAIFMVAGIASFIINQMLNVAESQTVKTQTLWDDSLIYAIRKPAKASVWIIAAIMSFDVIEQNSKQQAVSSVIDYVQPERYTLFVVLILCWFSLRFIKQAEKVLIDPSRLKKPMDLTTVHALGKAFKAAVYIVACLVVLQTIGVSVSGILAFGGIGGIGREL